MSDNGSSATAVLSSARFQRQLMRLTTSAVAADMPALRLAADEEQVDWRFALLCCSALTGSGDEAAHAAVLRVAQGCMVADVDGGLKDAAAVLLERLGNWPAIDLATSRGLVEPEAWTATPAPLQMDVIRRRLQLRIVTDDGEDIAANLFQREFWDAASLSNWLSISAPTSAGKSFIVKRWFGERASLTPSFRGVYIVPTRALIEEVSSDLRSDLGDKVSIFTLPWDASIGGNPREVFVLTQERLHLLQERLQDFAPSLIFVDEAQKLADESRGVLLQQVIDEALRRSPIAQLVFASPLASNPEILLEGAPQAARPVALSSVSVTVNQNLLWANQVTRKPRSWTLSLLANGGEEYHLANFELPARPSPESQRLPLVAVALGGGEPGNVIYVNGAASAEKAALQVYDALGIEADVSADPEIAALRELVLTAVHPQYALAEVLNRGVAFHYGNIPLIVKSQIERLFRDGKLRYLVCTSTLLEGVNLPCRNLFVRGPKKGSGNVMTAADFWNLAGRAGRWGKEFQGNIVCVDTRVERVWPSPPRSRTRGRISRATDDVLSNVGALEQYIEQEGTEGDSLLDAVFSFLAARVAKDVPLTSVAGLTATPSQLEHLQSSIRGVLETVQIPASVIGRHAGINPVAMQRLLTALDAGGVGEEGLLAPPESNDAAESYVRALAICNEFLGATFGPSGRQWQISILITAWMRGLSLPYLINERVAFLKSRGSDMALNRIIRDVMQDVEQVARFQAPKYLACYSDVLSLRLQREGLQVPAGSELDVTMMLELGVSRPTEVSLMALGLSRASAIALSEFIVADDLTPEGCLEWLSGQDLETLGLPALLLREVSRAAAGSEASNQ